MYTSLTCKQAGSEFLVTEHSLPLLFLYLNSIIITDSAYFLNLLFLLCSKMVD